MKMQIGEASMSEVSKGWLGTKIPFVSNKTQKYLVPCLKKYGPEFEKRYASAFKVAIGLGDMIISDTAVRYEQHLFILFETKQATRFFIEFLEWVKEQDYYEDDYVFGNIQSTTQHMVIVKLPDECVQPLEVFLYGFYSSMYPVKEIDDLFKNHPEVQKVLIKDHNYRIQFVGKLNKEYGSTVKPSEYDGELDVPPKESDEYFNIHLKK